MSVSAEGGVALVRVKRVISNNAVLAVDDEVLGGGVGEQAGRLGVRLGHETREVALHM